MTILHPGHAQTFRMLYSFTGGADGETPFSPLLRDAAANFYGTGETDGDFGNGIFFKPDAQTEEGLRRDLVLQART